MKYRSRTEIASSILEAANGGVTKTKIMYKAFFSFAQLREHITMLEGNGLLIYEPSSQIFRTTEKGMKLLTLTAQIDQLAAYGNTEKEITQRMS